VKIVVLVKSAYLPDPAGDGLFAADLTARRDAAPARLGEADERAVEAARRIACRRRDVQISALTMGPRPAGGALRRALVLGADEGVHVLDDALHGSDAPASARVLAAAARRLGFDLVLCAAASADAGTGVVPTMVAELLGVPSLCFADAVDLAHAEFGGPRALDEVVVRRDRGDAVDEVAAPLPALVSVTEQCAAPRYPTVRAVIEARQKLVRTWTLRDLGMAPAGVGLRAAGTVARRVTARGGRRPGAVVRDDEHGGAAAALADFLAERHLI